MHLRRAIPRRASSAGAHLASIPFSIAFLLLALAVATPQHAQSPQSESRTSPTYTLHLYTRLVELPTLVLRDNYQPVRSLAPKNINIQLDLSPSFHPTSIRLEGDDPILLSILIDINGEPSPLLTALQKNFSTWLASSFKPQDRISLYAMNCNLFLTAYDRPPNPTLLVPALDSVIASAKADPRSGDPACKHATGLPDYLDFILKQASPLPGRRVLLVLANGNDEKGVAEWGSIVTDAALNSVTTFGINVPETPVYAWGPLYQGVGSFSELIQRSGGLNMSSNPDLLPNTLSQLIQLLRDRYVLQFPDPPNLTNTIHQVVVTVNKSTTLIRPSSITVSLTNPSTQTGPVNIPVETQPANPTPPQSPPAASPNP